jgi:hypothetical protein
MEDLSTILFSDPMIEILAPEHDTHPRADAKTCLCCCRQRPSSCMDDDGCGICDECLRP